MLIIHGNKRQFLPGPSYRVTATVKLARLKAGFRRFAGRAVETLGVAGVVKKDRLSMKALVAAHLAGTGAADSNGLVASVPPVWAPAGFLATSHRLGEAKSKVFTVHFNRAQKDERLVERFGGFDPPNRRVV